MVLERQGVRGANAERAPAPMLEVLLDLRLVALGLCREGTPFLGSSQLVSFLNPEIRECPPNADLISHTSNRRDKTMMFEKKQSAAEERCERVKGMQQMALRLILCLEHEMRAPSPESFYELAAREVAMDLYREVMDLTRSPADAKRHPIVLEARGHAEDLLKILNFHGKALDPDFYALQTELDKCVSALGGYDEYLPTEPVELPF